MANKIVRLQQLTPRIHTLARDLLAYEALTELEPSGSLMSGFRVAEKLRRPLGRLIGTGGFRSLLVRALTLAKAQAPLLTPVQILPDGSFEGWTNLGQEAEVAEASTLVVAHLLELLVTFVGQKLVVNLLHEVWPEFSAVNPAILEDKSW